MSGGKIAAIVLLFLLAVGVAGYSFYKNFVEMPDPGGTPESRAAAIQKLRDFNKSNQDRTKSIDPKPPKAGAEKHAPDADK